MSFEKIVRATRRDSCLSQALQARLHSTKKGGLHRVQPPLTLRLSMRLSAALVLWSGLPDLLLGWPFGPDPAGNPSPAETIRFTHGQVVSARGDRGGSEDRREAP